MNQGGFTYWAYYTLGNQSSPYEIHLARSNSLTSGWVDYGKVFDGRWPSVYYDGSTFHMIYRKSVTPDAYGLRRATSSDGISWTFQEDVVSDANNPYLWKNPNDNLWYLFYHDSNGAGNRIVMRSASSIADLDAASPVVLINQSAVIASPSVYYRNNKYYLMAEALNGSTWITKVFSSDYIAGPYLEAGNSPILTNNDACAMPIVSGNTLYVYYAELTDAGNNYWDVILRTLAL